MSPAPQELLALSRGVRWDFPSSAGVAIDDRFELDWLRDQLR